MPIGEMCKILYNKIRKIALYIQKKRILYNLARRKVDDKNWKKWNRKEFLGMSYIDTIKEKARSDRKQL